MSTLTALTEVDLSSPLLRGYVSHPYQARWWVKQWLMSTISGLLPDRLRFTNPFDRIGLDWQKDVPSIHKKHLRCHPQMIVHTDLQKIKDADFMLVILPSSGRLGKSWVSRTWNWLIGQQPITFGVAMEMVYAKALGKRVEVICLGGQEMHPWIRYHADDIYTSTSDYIDKQWTREEDYCRRRIENTTAVMDALPRVEELCSDVHRELRKAFTKQRKGKKCTRKHSKAKS